MNEWIVSIGTRLASDILGEMFNITKTHRDHMAVYVCVADNGIPPRAYRSFNVEVHCKF